MDCGGDERQAELVPAAPQATLERFIALLEGADSTRSDDPTELLAVARATVRSALADNDGAPATSLVQALGRNLGVHGRPAPFVREYSPELVTELLAAVASGLVSKEECRDVIQLLPKKCSVQEVYTFTVEALCSTDLSWPALIEGVDLLRLTVAALSDSKRHNFLGSCLPVLLQLFTQQRCPQEFLIPKLAALQKFADAFLVKLHPSEATVDLCNPVVVVQSMITAFLYKLLQRSFHALGVEALALAPTEGEADATSRTSRMAPQEVRLRCSSRQTEALIALSALAYSSARSSSRPLLSLLEDMDLGDPSGDGGGDLEIAPLCLAAHVCLLEVHCCWRDLKPYVVPICLSPARRVNVLMRSVFVLVSNREDAPAVVGLGDLEGESDAAVCSAPKSRWALQGLALFANSATPLLAVAAEQTPQAFKSLSGTLCRWYPVQTFKAVLEALVSAPDIDREARSALFKTAARAMRIFDWPCRFELYLQVVRECRLDTVIGAVVTLFKDDWWAQVQALTQGGESLHEERGRLVKVLKATLSGDLHIVDGMDTLTAALNIARLVALARPPAGPFLRAALLKEGGIANSGGFMDLEAMLAGISKQIDVEIRLLDSGAESAAGELARQLEEALGRSEGGDAPPDLGRLKRDRIAMVAHLVARVRELLASAPADGES